MSLISARPSANSNVKLGSCRTLLGPCCHLPPILLRAIRDRRVRRSHGARFLYTLGQIGFKGRQSQSCRDEQLVTAWQIAPRGLDVSRIGVDMCIVLLPPHKRGLVTVTDGATKQWAGNPTNQKQLSAMWKTFPCPDTTDDSTSLDEDGPPIRHRARSLIETILASRFSIPRHENSQALQPRRQTPLAEHDLFLWAEFQAFSMH